MLLNNKSICKSNLQFQFRNCYCCCCLDRRRFFVFIFVNWTNSSICPTAPMHAAYFMFCVVLILLLLLHKNQKKKQLLWILQMHNYWMHLAWHLSSSFSLCVFFHRFLYIVFNSSFWLPWRVPSVLHSMLRDS